MKPEHIVLGVVGLSVVAFYWLRYAGHYCSECKVRLKYAGVTYISDRGTETLYKCPKCNGRVTVHSY